MFVVHVLFNFSAAFYEGGGNTPETMFYPILFLSSFLSFCIMQPNKSFKNFHGFSNVKKD